MSGLDDLMKQAEEMTAGQTPEPEGPMSPARKRPGGPVRNCAQMKPEKLIDLVAQMQTYKEKDPDAYAKVMAVAEEKGLA